MVFSMPRSFARSDLIFTDLLAGDVGGAQTAWKSSWEDAEHATAWTRWLIYGRLAAARAEIALRAETPESALEWSQRAIDIAVSTRRRKYEAQARISRGHAMTALGRREDAFAEFESAVRIADDLVGAPARFNARAELARAAYALGDDERAAAAAGEARVLVADFAATLAPERARALLGSPLAQEVLGA
jgi:tetratricopeptide (TPR) repeat protein